jgi:hypothetical protein
MLLAKADIVSAYITHPALTAICVNVRFQADARQHVGFERRVERHAAQVSRNQSRKWGGASGEQIRCASWSGGGWNIKHGYESDV